MGRGAGTGAGPHAVGGSRGRVEGGGAAAEGGAAAGQRRGRGGAAARQASGEEHAPRGSLLC